MGMVSALTWVVCECCIDRRLKRRAVSMGKCPYNTPCLKYDEVETKDAVKRISKLILENLEKEELHKKKLYEDLASGRLG